MAPSAFGSWQDSPCLAEVEVPLDEGQWALGLKNSYEALYSYTTHDKDTHSRVLLSKCNSKIIALNCGDFSS